jgi:hypothetical protein
MSHSEQQGIVKFLCKKGKSAVEMLVSLNALYGEDEKANVCNWYNQFQNHQESLENKESYPLCFMLI